MEGGAECKEVMCLTGGSGLAFSVIFPAVVMVITGMPLLVGAGTAMKVLEPSV